MPIERRLGYVHRPWPDPPGEREGSGDDRRRRREKENTGRREAGQSRSHPAVGRPSAGWLDSPPGMISLRWAAFVLWVLAAIGEWLFLFMM